MANKNTGSVAPKERVNISYRPATGGAKERVELPFKVLVLGQFTPDADESPLESRSPRNINKTNFDDVMASMNLKLDFTASNRLQEGGEDISISIAPKSLKDFEPDNIVQKVPELQQVLQLREALKALKGPLGNTPKMRKTIQLLLADDKSRKQLMAELGLK
ncbi:type VI secretion system protein ImpB [Oceanospirillum multiglobuliferum]|uniref:Type VI secretion system-associated protein n=1 Tax=Oceanospirillum multiglobuliferum TaxID=64969 RepID=A0A1T4MSH9_9GAMM|nr:type VI secretion system contractile sheath small subunit [Oceanospirillum multiglobuliferum]OPX56906.1 type VI secretion system-associated protein [Oceanospirillum multiglobuliferum]SJZ69923.1 type VI secretion system protein ImpB [Oceanospirillum multiglobuliferum]